MKSTKFALVAALGLALTFTLSCSSGKDDDNGGGGGGNNKCSDIANCKTVKIGNQIWMAENLNYRGNEPDTLGSCYEDDIANCNKYGRLYSWAEAMALPGCNSKTCASQVGNYRGICPESWHLPSKDEWYTLVDFVGGSSIAGKKLKARSGWNEGGNGTDDYGFSALPGGEIWHDGRFNYVGYRSEWWSTSESSYDMAYRMRVNYDDDDGGAGTSTQKAGKQSVRCVKDN